MQASEEIRQVESLLRRVKAPLRKDQIRFYLMKKLNINSEQAESVIAQTISRKYAYYGASNIICFNPGEKIKREIMIGFWAYLYFMEETEDRLFLTEYPSVFGMDTLEDVYLVTLCENKYKDNAMIALREKKKDDYRNIIIGVNIPFDEINKEMLPEKPFIYMEFAAKNIMTDRPEITVKAIT